MAMTVPRWVAVFVLASGALAVALLPAPPPGSALTRPNRNEPSRVVRLGGQLTRARDQLATARLHEAVVRAVGSSPRDKGPFLLDIGSSTAEQRARFMEALLAWWPSVPMNDSIAVAIVLGGDSTARTWQRQYMFPASTDGRTCVAILPTNTWLPRSGLTHFPLAQRLTSELGPCIFFALHGRPGPAIERWIEGRGVNFISYFNLTARQPAGVIPVEEATPTLRALFQLEWFDLGRLPSGLECVKGVTESCASGVYNPATDTSPLSHGVRIPILPWREPFGPHTESFISDLHAAIGAERFLQFWRSERPFPEAFQQASGQELGQWTQQWARSNLGYYEPGPAPGGSGVIRIVGISLLLFGVAVIVGTRRTVAG